MAESSHRNGPPYDIVTVADYGPRSSIRIIQNETIMLGRGWHSPSSSVCE